MDDIIKMVGYFVIGCLVIFVGWEIFSALMGFLMALTTTPIGIVILLVAALAVLRFVSK